MKGPYAIQLLPLIAVVILPLCGILQAQPLPRHNLQFNQLATRWDEAMPLGNGMLGALVYQKNNRVRVSIDRADLWDDRPMPDIDKLTFAWVAEKVRLNQYDSVQKWGDEPYEKYPAPTKLPGAALEFDCTRFGKLLSNVLDIKTALNTVRFANGVVMNHYIHATRNEGYFGFENITGEPVLPQLIIPAYNNGDSGRLQNSVEGQGLQRLGYAKGTVTRGTNYIRYRQPTWNGHYYEVYVDWYRLNDKVLIGRWTIANDSTAALPPFNIQLPEPTYWPQHIAWWKDYWSRSAIRLPDAVLEKQYYLDMYKFGCVARANTPPISLQAVWTADNGLLPPWKGDFHHDLNTQLSYWPGYTANHLDLTAGLTNWLWKVMPEHEKWTRQYFETGGLNVPGVSTISGKPMGGWIQYSMSPTTSAWLAQHFYWQWKYGMDAGFLKSRAAAYIGKANHYLAELILKNMGKDTVLRLPLSSSPEHNDNAVTAWYSGFTNFDYSLFRALHQFEQNTNTNNPGYFPGKYDWEPASYIDAGFNTNATGLTIAPGQSLTRSHRHHSHLMAIYPLALLDMNDAADTAIISQSLRHLGAMGTREWTGYSFAWAACLYARARWADSAVRMLQKFATNFVSPNSFHLNGDQRGGQYSDYTYRPFTLEGNFAFAQGVHEMLLQSKENYIEVFPAVPADWRNVSFKNLRTYGAFLVSAEKENGVPKQITVKAAVTGTLRLKLPFRTWVIRQQGVKHSYEKGLLVIAMKKGQVIKVENGYE